ncbi:hypothetical protein HanHA300_Chr01g0031671 [Helianthus annuus]|nr:hypothetical protein HanHA300_Chr01g0031671 [Helianthus annuus]KAJ0784501.1 hypothetical protein HanLR1_Chr01g0032721 [Helianthus annuus]
MMPKMGHNLMYPFQMTVCPSFQPLRFFVLPNVNFEGLSFIYIWVSRFFILCLKQDPFFSTNSCLIVLCLGFLYSIEI